MKYTISTDEDQIARAQTMMGHKCPPGHVSIGVATENGASLPTGLVVRNKKTGVAWLAVGQVLRSIEPSIIGGPKKTGRPSKAPGERLIVVPVRMSEAQKAKYQRMENGPQRLRDWLDRVKE